MAEMKFAEIKKAIIDYANEVDTETKAVTQSFQRIANAQSALNTLENKWINGANTLETAINAITDPTVKDSYFGQLNLLRTQKGEVEAMLTTLDTVVTENGLQLV